MKVDLMADITALQAKIRARMAELETAVAEAAILNEINDIVEYSQAEIAKLKRPTGTKTNVKAWARERMADEIVGASELAENFDKSHAWARMQFKWLVDEGVMEKWGRGQWRLVPDRAGEARLRVLTA